MRYTMRHGTHPWFWRSDKPDSWVRHDSFSWLFHTQAENKTTNTRGSDKCEGGGEEGSVVVLNGGTGCGE